jgi:hypothetical protein
LQTVFSFPNEYPLIRILRVHELSAISWRTQSETEIEWSAGTATGSNGEGLLLVLSEDRNVGLQLPELIFNKSELIHDLEQGKDKTEIKLKQRPHLLVP